MVLRLDHSDQDFATRFDAFLTTKREVSADVNADVTAIIDEVRARGDEALHDFTQKFDRLDTRAAGLRVTEAEITAAYEATDPTVIEALQIAHDRIASHHSRQMPKDDYYEDAIGVGLGSRWTAVEAVGLYVPGGTASYPSSVLMNAVPAKVAGVERIVMVVPAREGELNPAVLAAANKRPKRSCDALWCDPETRSIMPQASLGLAPLLRALLMELSFENRCSRTPRNESI